MKNLLKRHPFAVEAFFESSVVLTFAVEKEELAHLIPPCLELDTFQDKWAFLAVAMVQTSNLRPKGFPKILGQDFFLIGYRIFVRFTNKEGRRLRGLYIIKSETDKKRMQIAGNIFTHYNYTTTDIEELQGEETTEIRSLASNFHLTYADHDPASTLPKDSPFETWKEARRFAGPLPFTFTYQEEEKTVLIIEGVRSNWNPHPIEVKDYQFEYVEQLNLQGCVLANAFKITQVPYYWKKAKIERWQ